MNKNSKNTIVAVIVIVVVVLVIWYVASNSSSNPGSQSQFGVATGSTTESVNVSQTQVSGSTSLYENAELGFSVRYPSSWEKDESTAGTGVQFVMPIDQTQVSTVAK